jgi:hypothetical protein
MWGWRSCPAITAEIRTDAGFDMRESPRSRPYISAQIFLAENSFFSGSAAPVRLHLLKFPLQATSFGQLQGVLNYGAQCLPLSARDFLNL